MSGPTADAQPAVDLTIEVMTADALARVLAIPDQTDQSAVGAAGGLQAFQLLIGAATDALQQAWGCQIRVRRSGPIVSVEDNYDRLGYAAIAVTRDRRYTRYVSETCMLRSHTSALVPPALRALAAGYSRDVLLVCPGLVYRRDVIDRLHTGTPHQLDLWRIVRAAMGPADLDAMIASVVGAVLPGAEYRTTPAVHPYTEGGLQIDVLAGGQWVEIGECGLAAPAVLSAAGLDTRRVSGLAMGLGLDRVLMLRKGIADIRVLRSADARVQDQLHDLASYRPVSRQPAIVRDLSVAVDGGDTEEDLGDRVREALGPRSDAVEAVEVLSWTPGLDLPSGAARRLGLRPGQHNVLLRVVLRDLDRTLTSEEANELRDRVYAALHRGTAHVWAGGRAPD